MSWRRRESNPADDALHNAPVAESRALRLVEYAGSGVMPRPGAASSSGPAVARHSDTAPVGSTRSARNLVLADRHPASTSPPRCRRPKLEVLDQVDADAPPRPSSPSSCSSSRSSTRSTPAIAAAAELALELPELGQGRRSASSRTQLGAIAAAVDRAEPTRPRTRARRSPPRFTWG